MKSLKLHTLGYFGSTLLCLVVATAAALSLPGCDGKSEQAATSTSLSHKVKDHEAYNLGKAHAEKLLRHVDDEDAVQESLLEVRAISSNINSKISHQSALDYEKGFLDYIHANCDSLAKIID